MGKYVFKLPDLGEGTVESEVVDWHVQPGERVEEDQHIADVMTDKATVEISSPVAGTVVELGCEAGQVLAVGAPLITFEVEGDGNASTTEPAGKKSEPVPEPEPAPEPEPVPKPAPAARPAVQSAPVTAAFGKALASPAVRKRALEAEINLADVPGSGPAGRIRHEDLDAFIAAGGRLTGAPGRAKRTGREEIPVRGLRRMIAEKMQQSKRQIPHFTYVEEVDVTELEALRQHLNANRRPEQPKLTVLPFIMQALVRVLREFPQFNATFDDQNNVITRYEAVHLGIAAQTDTGLKVPVVKHTEAMDIWECAAELLRVSQAAKENTATKEELTGASITITSLGPLGGVVHTPVINYPEVAIIGTNKMIERPVVQDGQIAIRKMMNLSSSFDHRVVDGYDAAQMIQRLKLLLEHPATIFM